MNESKGGRTLTYSLSPVSEIRIRRERRLGGMSLARWHSLLLPLSPILNTARLHRATDHKLSDCMSGIHVTHGTLLLTHLCAFIREAYRSLNPLPPPPPRRHLTPNTEEPLHHRESNPCSFPSDSKYEDVWMLW